MQSTTSFSQPAGVVAVDVCLGCARRQLRSTSLTTNESGVVVSELRYKAWGEVRCSSGATPTDYKYTGQLETDTGLYYYVARFYAPYLNRWIQPDTIIPDQYNPLDLDRYSYARNSPINFNDPTGHDVGCTTVDPDCLDSNGLTERFKIEMKLAAARKLKVDGWDLVLVVADVRGIVRGAQVAKWAAEQPDYMDQQFELQSWQNECYGQCHYAEAIENDPVPSLVGGPMPETPIVDTYSEGMGEIGGNVIVLGLTAATAKISLSDTQVFSHGGTDWHIGLEASNNMNIVHIGNHPVYGPHIAYGAVKPFVANLHIYIQSSLPFIRIWRP